MPRSNIAKTKQKKKAKAKKHNKAKALAAAVVQSNVMEEEKAAPEVELEQEGDCTTENSKTLSMGALIRRHKAENKKLKLEIEIMNKERSKLKKEEKERRRQITRDIRNLETQMKQKHATEIEEFNKTHDPNAQEQPKDSDMAIEQ